MALNHMLCDAGRGGGEGVRTCMASSVGVRVVQQGAAGLARRLAMGEPLGAILEGEIARVGWALLRVGEVGRVVPRRPPSLPRGLVAPCPLRSLSACASKVTLRLMVRRSLRGKNWGMSVCDATRVAKMDAQLLCAVCLYC